MSQDFDEDTKKKILEEKERVFNKLMEEQRVKSYTFSQETAKCHKTPNDGGVGYRGPYGGISSSNSGIGDTGGFYPYHRGLYLGQISDIC